MVRLKVPSLILNAGIIDFDRKADIEDEAEHQKWRRKLHTDLEGRGKRAGGQRRDVAGGHGVGLLGGDQLERLDQISVLGQS